MNRRYKDLQACAHAWAHQHSPYGKASSLFFENACIYSWGKHFPIAFIDGDRVFFTLKKYSLSTSNHKNIVSSAISHKDIVFVNHVPESAEELNSPEWMNKNIQYWAQEIRDLLIDRHAHPRKKSLNHQIQHHVYRLMAFYAAIGGVMKEDVAALLHDPNLVTIDKFVRKEAINQKARIRRNYRTAVSEWRNGLRANVPAFSDQIIDNNIAYLRLNPVMAEIETSKGIRVPFETGRRFWQYIQSVLPDGCQNCHFTILNFEVKEISQERIVVGCHTIPMKEARKIAQQLGWLVKPGPKE